ncbi:MAG: DUF1611 domain-containing protein [Candidatus Thermoplasmatota archaeon]|jgi:uncharacterized NAD-dependent epimerase/dehydratase family protein|nr:DUF1611 domain-containing protein [Candidatus Thermoplasmatota archaeon]
MLKNQAVVYADRLYSCADGKTAHGLVRFSKKYDIVCVVDSTLPKSDAGEILDGINRGIPLVNDLEEVFSFAKPDTFIVGAVSEGGVLPKGYEKAVEWALSNGLDVVSGLHQFISDDPVFSKLAEKNNCTITDVRKIFRDHRRFYTGEIKNVESFRVAVLGTDSAIGKRTLAVLIVEELEKRGYKADMIYTGQTGWLQGWPHGVIIDAMVNDFVSGGIEGAILDSWRDEQPDFMIIEGQGSLVHPFFPGGFEILVAGKINGFLLMDAPKRPHLDGFPGYPMPNPERVVKIAELLTEKSLFGIGINHENMKKTDIKSAKEKLSREFRVPVVDPIFDGVDAIVDVLEEKTCQVN